MPPSPSAPALSSECGQGRWSGHEQQPGQRQAPVIVLLAEDETLVRMVAAEMLREEGSFKVIEAADADQALTVLEATTNVQALVTDVEMPGSLDGFTLARLVRQAWPHIGIVVTSGRVRPGPKDLPSGTLFIAKPYSLAALVDAVRTVLHPPQAGNASKTSVPMLPAGSNVGQPDTGIGISGGLAQPLPEAEE